MHTPLLWFAALSPLAIAAITLIPRSLGDQQAGIEARWAQRAALAASAIAVVTAVSVAVWGTLTTGTIGVAGIGFGLYLDAISAAMFVLVSFIGAVVVAYSRNYLDGDPGGRRFIRGLCGTLASVLALIIAGNMAQFLVFWIATSIGLHGLLLFYPERPAAVLAARKKFLASRLGDLCLILAMAMIYRTYGSLDYVSLFARISTAKAEALPAAAILLAVAALVKSAQFPLHGWLIEVMETPTPVSALLHAGIINAGGFLVLRFAGIIAPSTTALDMLAIIGGLTALFGSMALLTQTSIKVSLAYSTIAQMGFMMLECGLGAFSAALLHIVAHSLYKAHAFLSSGGVIDIARASWSPSPGGQPHPSRLAIANLAVIAVAVEVGSLFDATPFTRPGVFALGVVMLFGLTHLVANSIDERPSAYVIGRTVGLAGLVTVAYFALQWIAERLVGHSLPPAETLRGPVEFVIVAFVILSFGALTIFQGLLPRHAEEPKWQELYAHVANGLYVNTIGNRLLLRAWPIRPPAAANLAPNSSAVKASS